jgi:predicted nucleic acid-binding protein
MYLIDTNVISELRKERAGRADARVVNWARRVGVGQMFVAAHTLFELELGVLLLQRRDPVQAAVLRGWLQQSVLNAFEGRILPASGEAALRYTALHVARTRPERDAWIAATALVHGMTVVTRNVEDFQPMDVVVLNPWDYLG